MYSAFQQDTNMACIKTTLLLPIEKILKPIWQLHMFKAQQGVMLDTGEYSYDIFCTTDGAKVLSTAGTHWRSEKKFIGQCKFCPPVHHKKTRPVRVKIQLCAVN